MSPDDAMSHTPGESRSNAFRARFPEALIACFEAEARATTARVFNVAAFPVQTQHSDYIAAVLRSYRGSFTEDMIEDAIAARVARRDAFLRSGLRASVIVDASVLRRPVGSNAVMRAQHAWARELHSSGRVPIKVVDGFYYGMETSYSLFTVDGEVVAFEETEKGTVNVGEERRDELVARFGAFKQRAIDLLDHPLAMAAA